MSESEHAGMAKEQLTDLKDRLHGGDFADKPEWDGSRALVMSAIKSSNGSADKIRDMAETQGLLVHFMVQEKLRAPMPVTQEQLARALLEVHDAACPLGEVVTRDGMSGKRRIDPSKLMALLPAAGRTNCRTTLKDRVKGAAVSLSYTEGIKAKGLPAVIFAVLVAVGVTLYGINRWQSAKFQKMLDAKLDAVLETAKYVDLDTDDE